VLVWVEVAIMEFVRGWLWLECPNLLTGRQFRFVPRKFSGHLRADMSAVVVPQACSLIVPEENGLICCRRRFGAM
jgi:hypothetical protein